MRAFARDFDDAVTIFATHDTAYPWTVSRWTDDLSKSDNGCMELEKKIQNTTITNAKEKGHSRYIVRLTAFWNELSVTARVPIRAESTHIYIYILFPRFIVFQKSVVTDDDACPNFEVKFSEVFSIDSRPVDTLPKRIVPIVLYILKYRGCRKSDRKTNVKRWKRGESITTSFYLDVYTLFVSADNDELDVVGPPPIPQTSCGAYANKNPLHAVLLNVSREWRTRKK